MQIEYSITTIQQKGLVLRALVFLAQPHIISLLDDSPQLKTKSGNQTVFINVVGSKRMKTLNDAYREKNTSTDVLSFELYENGIMGELYICPDDISKNAKYLGHTFEQELLEIIIHGLLHLSGYDHSDEMFAWQKTLNDRILGEYENISRTR